MNTRLLFAASVLPWLLLATAACSAQDSQVVEVQAEFLTDVTVEGEPLMLILKVATRTPDDALLEFGHFYEENVQAWITASNGTVYEKHVLRPGGFGSSGAAPLKAGSLWQHVYVLDEWFPPLPEGVYRLRMIVPEMARTNEGKTLRVGQPQELTFSIAARDSARLKVRCQALLEDILHSKSAEIRIVAITALTHVADPVVIPYLAAAIRQNPYAGNLFSAFLNFPENGQAADTVISLLEIGGDTAERAGSVLRSLAARTKDTQIKSRIERALQPELRR